LASTLLVIHGCSKSRDSRCEDMGKVVFQVRVPALIMHGSEGGDCSITSIGGAGLSSVKGYPYRSLTVRWNELSRTLEVGTMGF
jgi:hypothetical protein